MVAAILAVTGAISITPAIAWDQDFFGIYFQRTDKITPSAGDAKAVNEATHVIDPWPRYVGQRRIPGNGEKMVGAVNRYRTNQPAPSYSQGGISPAGAAALGGIGAAAAAAASPPGGH
jgi:hypothetical protein